MTTSTMATTATPGRSPTTRARCDDNELLPSPKKLKTESPSLETAAVVPRRVALRDVTNEVVKRGTASSAGTRSADAKKKLSPTRTKHKRRATVVSIDDVIFKTDDRPLVDSPAVADVDTRIDQKEASAPTPLDAAVGGSAVVAPPASPCVREEELRSFDPLMGQSDQDELAEILYTRLRENQMRHRVCFDYFEDQVQPHVNAKMRSILVDWLIEIHFRLQLTAETLFLAVNYLDRFLTEIVTTRSELQLVGLTCLFIAAKYEEVEPADLSDLSYVTKNTYTGEQIIEMERKIIDVLGFNLSAVTAEAFAGYFTLKLQADETASLLAAFFTQSTLLHLPLLVWYPPADRAAAAVYLAHSVATNGRPSDEWTSQWETTVATNLEDLLPCLQDLCTILAYPSKKLAALRAKFGTKRFGRVTTHSTEDLERFL